MPASSPGGGRGPVRAEMGWLGSMAERPTHNAPTGFAPSNLAARWSVAETPVKMGMRKPGIPRWPRGRPCGGAVFGVAEADPPPWPVGVTDEALEKGAEDGGYAAIVDGRAEDYGVGGFDFGEDGVEVVALLALAAVKARFLGALAAVFAVIQMHVGEVDDVGLCALFARPGENGFDGGMGGSTLDVAADDGHNFAAHMLPPMIFAARVTQVTTGRL